MTAMIAAGAILLPATTATFAASLSTSNKTAAVSKTTKRQSSKQSTSNQLSVAKPAQAYQPTASDCDLSGNQVVDVDDIMALLPAMGTPCNRDHCSTDINRDGRTSVNDLMLVIANFGAFAPSTSEMAETELNGAILSLQNWYAKEQTTLNSMGVSNKSVCISSYGLLVDGLSEEGALERCLNHTAEEVRDYLISYANHYGIARDTTDIVVLDIEGYRFSPMFFGNYIDQSISYYNPAMLDRILDAYKLRISVARDVFPNAKLGLYDTVTPHGFGEADLAPMIRRQRGYEYAASYGLFEELDYACPVLYQVWGETDYGFSRSDAVTRLGIEATRSLTRMDGTPLEIMPMMSLTVFNGDSNHDREPARVQDVSRQIDVLESLGINEYIIWNGEENIADTDIPVYDQLQQLLDYRENQANSTQG
jgi:hypothetical protein